MSLNLLGGGFSTNGYPADGSSGSSSGGVGTAFQGTCDASGIISIAIANADQKNGFCAFQEDSGGQGGFSRIDEANTTHLKFQADIQIEAEGLVAAGLYWEA